MTSLLQIGSGDGYDHVHALDVDGRDNIPGDGDCYFIGHFASNTVKFGNFSVNNTFQLNSAMGDVYVGKIYRNMSVAWFFSFGYGLSHDRGSGIALSSDGQSVYITGFFGGGNITIGSFNLKNSNTTSAAANDVYVAKLSASTGNAIWAVKFSGVLDDSPRSLVVDRGSNPETILVCGGTNSPNITIGSFNLFTSGVDDAFLARVDGATGTVLNATLLGGAGSESAWGLEVHDTTGNIYLSGSTSSTSLTFGGVTYTRTSSTTTAIFVAKFASDFTQKWLFTYSNSTSDATQATSLYQPTETLYVGGVFNGGRIFGNFTITNKIGVVAIDSSGQVVDAVDLSGATASGNDVRAIQVDSKGNVWVGGAAVTSTTITLGGVPYTNYGGTGDAWVALYDLALDPLWEPLV